MQSDWASCMRWPLGFGTFYRHPRKIAPCCILLDLTNHHVIHLPRFITCFLPKTQRRADSWLSISESGNMITTIQKHCAATLVHISNSLTIKKPCDNFRISSCGTFILFTRDTRVRVINTRTCATFTRFTHDTELCAVALHPTRNLAAVADVNGKICFLNDWIVKVCHWRFAILALLVLSCRRLRGRMSLTLWSSQVIASKKKDEMVS